jgi:serine/threonine-protein kinase
MYPQVFGKYILEGELARGGMARVLLATLRGAGGFEKKLVVKQIRDELSFDQEFVRRFVEEAKTTVALSHPNIVPVYELGVEQGTYFLAMELVNGVSIAELLDARLSPEEGAYVGVEICRALDYAHRRMNVVHRDITPRNVMVDEEGYVRVIDFGIAAPARVSGHEVLGSPGHMPPEQVEGKALGPATDLFAVAVLLMEAWGGVAPFRRATPAECDAAMRAPHPKPSAIDIRLLPLDDVIGRALSLDPRERPQDAEELGKTFRKFLTGIDLGDVAHALGDRVRRTRAALASKNDPPRSRGAARASQTSSGEIGTKTFAARKEVEVWTQSAAPSEEVRTPPSIHPETRKLAPSVPPPPRIPDAIETIATRPIVTGIGAGTKSRVALLSMIGASLVAIGVLGVPLVDPKAPASAPSAIAPAPVTPPPASAPAPLPSAVPVAAPSASASASSSAPSSATGPRSAPSAPAVAARVSLFGDPGTRVAIDGVARGACPLRDVTLDPGPHDVRFTFDPTGESNGERVVLKPGERVTMRADFASTNPGIRVQR